MSNGRISLDIIGKVATVEFYHPASNSLPSKLLSELSECFVKLSLNEDITVIVLMSDGEKAFCAGASLDELMAIENIEDGKSFFMGFARVINAMRSCNKPIIGRIQGRAVGGGVGLIAACDLAFATDMAAVKLSELSIGIGPFVIAPAVERKIGVSGLASLSLNPTQWKNVYWVQKTGLYADVFDSVEVLNKKVNELSEDLSKSNPEALREMKNMLWENTDHWEKLLAKRAALSGKLVLSDFTRKALQKFKK